jgi:hypothetical protein
MFSTLVCVFTLDRIGRRWTLYWGSVCQGIFMFLAGGMTRIALDSSASGNAARANSAGSAAAAFVGEYSHHTFANNQSSSLRPLAPHGSPCRGSIPPRSFPSPFEPKVMLLAWSAGLSGTDGS